MKTQVIQLETYDDVVSVRDKMSWAKTDRIALVFPRHSRIIARILDLRLLQRHADFVGARLAIVTRSTELKLVAKELGIPVFARLSTAKRKNWQSTPTPRKEFPRQEKTRSRELRRIISPPQPGWQDQSRFRLLLFALAVAAILAVGLTFVPSASVHLTPKAQTQSLTFRASASANFTAVNLTGNLPAHSLSLIIEQTRSVPATGSIAIPDARAAGNAQFRNLTTAMVIIPAGTVIGTQIHPIVHFTTTTQVEVPAGVGKTVDVPLVAVEAGSIGNLPVDTLVAIQGDLGTSLGVTNPQPTMGGSYRIATIQTARDRNTLHTSLMNDILGECRNELQQRLLPGDIFFPGSLADYQAMNETYFPGEDQAGDTLTLTLRLQCKAQYASAVDMNTLAGKLLDLDLPQGFIPVPGSLELQPAGTPITGEDGITRWDQGIHRLLQPKINSLQVEQISLGHLRGTAAKLLAKSLSLAEPPKIQIKPGGWPWMPLIPFRITVFLTP